MTDIDPGFAAVQRLAAESEALRELLVQADSMLSLLRHRGDIRNWGATGMIEQHEVDALIGRLRRAYEPVRPT